MSTLISLQDGFERLRLAYDAPVACERLNVALRENRVRLYCNGRLVSPGYIAAQMRVVAELEGDGRWVVRVVPKGLGFARTDYVWQVDAEGIDGLLPPISTSGDRSKAQWHTHLSRELQSLRRKGSPLLKDFEQLAQHLAAISTPAASLRPVVGRGTIP